MRFSKWKTFLISSTFIPKKKEKRKKGRNSRWWWNFFSRYKTMWRCISTKYIYKKLRAMFNLSRNTQKLNMEKSINRETYISIFLILNCVLIEQQVVILSLILLACFFSSSSNKNFDTAMFSSSALAKRKKGKPKKEEKNFIYQSFVTEEEKETEPKGNETFSFITLCRIYAKVPRVFRREREENFNDWGCLCDGCLGSAYELMEWSER